MANENRPRGRKRNESGQSTGVHIGEGLGTGPVGGRGSSIGGSGSAGGSGGGRRGFGGMPLIVLILIFGAFAMQIV